ncbi:MAG: integrase arm-type DNA-binding domain-containing protein [Alphaproteobacteria bacterium]|nr:integrase arm-type DNA-binding domain-containing protein [Alphaproteobacteria bacterium]
MSLSDTAIRRAVAKNRAYKLYDAGGLFLLVMPSGGKWWRFKYRFNKKEKLLSLGTYPDVSLKMARERRDQERKKLVERIDPAINRKAVKAAWQDSQANTFEVVAREWVDKQSAIWTPANVKKVKGHLELNIFPWIGNRPIADITPPELLAVLRRIEARGAIHTAHRVLQTCGQTFRYAVATGRAMRDPAADLRGALQPVKEGHFAAITSPKAIGSLLRSLYEYKGSVITRCALRLAPLVFVRPGELRRAEWTEIDFDKAEWNIPAERMKMRESHLVPLSHQALDILKELHPLTGRGAFVFPSHSSSKRPMSDNAVLCALRRMGIGKDEMTGHGFRAMARTVLDEVLHVRPDYIEHQLAHAVRDPNGRAYNRTAHLDERRKMMQDWADYLEKLREHS